MSEPIDIPDLCPEVDVEACCMPVEDNGIEFFDVCNLDQGHRLQIRQQLWGLELVVLHGPKCDEGAGTPTEALRLSHEQCEVLAAYAVRRRQIKVAIADVAAAMRAGEADPERITSIAMGAILNLNPDEIISSIAQMTDEKARKLHSS